MTGLCRMVASIEGAAAQQHGESTHILEVLK
jgi:hypothetical protein